MLEEGNHPLSHLSNTSPALQMHHQMEPSHQCQKLRTEYSSLVLFKNHPQCSLQNHEIRVLNVGQAQSPKVPGEGPKRFHIYLYETAPFCSLLGFITFVN